MNDTTDIDDIINNLRDDDISNLHSGIEIQSSLDDSFQQTDLTDLKKAWLAERMSPDILAFQTSLIDRLMDRIRIQAAYIEENSMADFHNSGDIKMKLLIVESELERIKFLVRGYLRTRLSKIDKYTIYIIQSGENQQEGNADQFDLRLLLSPQEIQYMERHHRILLNLYNTQFLSALPAQLQRLDDSSGGISMVEEPDLDKPVFIRVLETVERPIRVGLDEITLEKGNIYVLRYSAISKYLIGGEVELI
ncbi:Sld5p [Sugiyamaella lignohabitans]|uniref:DNA replication complex GINS protein SLD5 n=1 Tax=Sugiyamaella lignohabitans TaxID=796027 RepID=A0A167EC91_9ASCO|nr:Sld5p [Sugiyamaella lignohabitans]ANB13896.1 Sld5p [Sugiyamaella lignohabitans]